MYEVRVEADFSAAHQVRLYDGELEPLHGHDWKIQAVFRGAELDEIDVLVDFVLVESALRDVAALFHHQNLNESLLLAGGNPTAERIAACAFRQLRERLGDHVPLIAVYVHEAPGCIAGYCPAAP